MVDEKNEDCIDELAEKIAARLNTDQPGNADANAARTELIQSMDRLLTQLHKTKTFLKIVAVLLVATLVVILIHIHFTVS